MEDSEFKNEDSIDIKYEEITYKEYKVQEPLCEIQGVQCVHTTYEDATGLSNKHKLIEDITDLVKTER